MDEIFDRIRSIKIKRKYLVLALICTELLGILILIWFLRTPLSQKFLITDPKAYSVVSLSPQKRYLLSQADYLTGKAIPNTTVKVLITPGFLKTQITADSKGDWWYQVPPELQTNIHRITFGNFDKSNKLVTFQSYKFRVQSNISLIKNIESFSKKILSVFKVTSAMAVNSPSEFIVKPYLVYPSDKSEIPEYETSVNKYLTYLQGWYFQQTSETFNLAPLEVFRLQESYDLLRCGRQEYEELSINCLNNPEVYQNKYLSNYLLDQIMLQDSSDRNTTVYAFFIAGGGGQAGANILTIPGKNGDVRFALVGDWVLEPLSGVANPWGIPCKYSTWQCTGGVPAGSMAHELGHAFGIPHPGEEYVGKSIMQWHGDFPKVGFLPEETTQLRNSAFFTQNFEDINTGSVADIIIVSAVTDLNDPSRIYIKPVVAYEGIEVNQANYDIEIIVIPYGSNPEDYGVSVSKESAKEENVRGVTNLDFVNELGVNLNNLEINSKPQDYQLCALLKPIDIEVVIDADCIPLDQVIDPQITTDSLDADITGEEPTEQIIESLNNDQTSSCPDPDWSNKETTGDFLCRGNEACYAAYQARPENSCQPEETGEYCEYDERCAEIQEAAGLESSTEEPAPLPQPETIYIEGEMFE